MTLSRPKRTSFIILIKFKLCKRRIFKGSRQPQSNPNTKKHQRKKQWLGTWCLQCPVQSHPTSTHCIHYDRSRWFLWLLTHHSLVLLEWAECVLKEWSTSFAGRQNAVLIYTSLFTASTLAAMIWGASSVCLHLVGGSIQYLEQNLSFQPVLFSFIVKFRFFFFHP